MLSVRKEIETYLTKLVLRDEKWNPRILNVIMEKVDDFSQTTSKAELTAHKVFLNYPL